MSSVALPCLMHVTFVCILSVADIEKPFVVSRAFEPRLFIGSNLSTAFMGSPVIGCNSIIDLMFYEELCVIYWSNNFVFMISFLIWYWWNKTEHWYLLISRIIVLNIYNNESLLNLKFEFISNNIFFNMKCMELLAAFFHLLSILIYANILYS